MHKTQQTKLIKSHLFTLVPYSITRSSLLGSGLPRNHLKLSRITIVSLFVIAMGILSSTVSLAHADSVQVVMAKGSATNQQCGDQCFVPNTVSIKAETIVIWKNDDSAAHTATEAYNSFDTGIVNAGATKSIVFRSGTHQYYCMIHPWMKGTVVVDDPSVPLTPTISTDNIITFTIKTDPNANANTDKYEYLTGETVNINGYNFVGNQPITIKILDSNQNKLAELTSGSSQTGVIQQTWKIPTDFKSGQYVIQINAPPIDARVPLEDFQSPAITVNGKVSSSSINNGVPITVRIVGPLVNGESKSILSISSAQLESDGSFEAHMGLLSNKKGDYKVMANYGPLKVESTFSVDGKSSQILVKLPALGRLSTDDNSDRGTAAMPDKKTAEYEKKQALQNDQAKLELEKQRLDLEKQKKELQQQKESLSKEKKQSQSDSNKSTKTKEQIAKEKIKELKKKAQEKAKKVKGKST